jgi:hypothetical protein
MADDSPTEPAKPAKPLPASLDLNWDELPVLTDYEMVFFNRILAGDSPEEAFRAARPDCETWQAGKVWRFANKLRRDIRLETCIAAAYANGGGGSDLPKAAHMRELERLREKALDAGNFGAAVKCEELRGKVAGLYIERHENVTPIDPVSILKSMAKVKGGEQLARSLAEAGGIPWAHVTGRPEPAAAVVVPLQIEQRALPAPTRESLE